VHRCREDYQLREAYVELSDLYYSEGALYEAISARVRALDSALHPRPEESVEMLNVLLQLAAEADDLALLDEFYTRAMLIKHNVPDNCVQGERKAPAAGVGRAEPARQAPYRPSASVLREEGIVERLRRQPSGAGSSDLLADAYVTLLLLLLLLAAAAPSLAHAH
jgi:hypothetical protein